MNLKPQVGYFKFQKKGPCSAAYLPNVDMVVVTPSKTDNGENFICQHFYKITIRFRKSTLFSADNVC